MERARHDQKLAEWDRISKAEADPRLQGLKDQYYRLIEINPGNRRVVEDALDSFANAKLNLEDGKSLASRGANSEIVEVEEWGKLCYYFPNTWVLTGGYRVKALNYRKEMWVSQFNEVLFHGASSIECPECKTEYEKAKLGFSEWYRNLKDYDSRRRSWDPPPRNPNDYRQEIPVRLFIHHHIAPDGVVWHSTTDSPTTCGK